MHYIRLVRPASVNTTNPNAPVLSLKLSITTDLGDTFLCPDDPVELFFRSESREACGTAIGSVPIKPLNGPAAWKAGMRVLQVTLPLEKSLARGRVDVRIECDVRRNISGGETQFLLPWRMKEYDITEGLVAPLLVELTDGVGSDVAVRPFTTNYYRQSIKSLSVEEEIGESIARHIWDAGLMTTAFLADACRSKKKELRISNFIPIKQPNINVLELGSGVGILGIGIATILHAAAEAQDVKLEQATVLLTDLSEAEERARANIKRYHNGVLPGEPAAEVFYENLDWEDGSKGQFGPLVSSRFWDYIALSDCTYNVDCFPMLVETLSSLHSHNVSQAPKDQEASTTSKVILATKPRHDSEKALFGMLENAGWKYHVLKSIPLLKLGDEDEVVDIYSLQKSSRQTVNPAKKRKSDDEEEKPAKKGSAS